MAVDPPAPVAVPEGFTALPGDGHAISVLVLVGVIVLALRMHRAAMSRKPPSPPACGWKLAGRDSEHERWIWYCTDCRGIGFGVDHQPPRACLDFHGHARAALRSDRVG